MIAIAISKKAWTATAKETTPGVAVTTPTVYIPTKTSFKGGKKKEYMNEERGDRNANYGEVDSIRQSSLEMKGPFYADTCPIMLWAGMGLPTTTQPNAGACPTVYKHTFNLSAGDPPTYTLFRHLDAKSYYIPYGVLEKWVLHYTVDGKVLELDSSWLGLFAQINASPPTPTYSTVLPMAGYAPILKFVDNAVSTDISDLQIEYQQKIALWYPSNGSPDFVTAYFGERTVTVDMTARFDNDVLYQRWRNNVQDSLNFDVQGAQICSTGPLNFELNIQLPQISWDTMEHDTSKENVLIKAKGTAIVPFGSTLMSGFVQNATAAYTS